MDVTVDFINSHFTDDIQSLGNAKTLYDEVLAKYEADKQRLEQQLEFITKEAPQLIEQSKVEAATSEAAVKRFEGEGDELAADVSNHLADVQPLVSNLSSLTGQIKELEKYSQYLQCLAHIEDLSSDIQSALLINAIERAVDQFVALVDLAQIIQQSKCRHLVEFVCKTVTFWYKILLDKLSCEFDEILSAYQWPFITASVRLPVLPKAAELREQLGPVLRHLVGLQLPDSLLTEKVSKPFSIPLPQGSHPFILPIQLLLKPFQKRFAFHFCGSEKTNRIDKPEWFYTQTLSWIRDHREFLRTRIQPELDSADLVHISAEVEFMRGLVVLIVNKLLSDVPKLLESDGVFAHFVDETLSFHNELRGVYGYPDLLPTCLQVLVRDDVFRMWIAIEKKFALEKMDAMLSSPTRWLCQYKSIADVDENKVSECGEAFMVLLSTVTERYRSLPSTWHQLQFVRLQLELLDDFRVRLIQVRSELLQAPDASPLTPQLCSILNTVSYIDGLLQQWTNLPFFVKLQFYKLQSDERKSQQNIAADVTSDSDDMFVDAAMDPNDSGAAAAAGAGGDVDHRVLAATSEHSDVAFDFSESSLSKLDVSLFDELINLYELLGQNMLKDIVSYVFDDVKARSRPYRYEKWLALPSQKDFVSLALSNSACEMLHVLKDHLHQMEQLLSRSLFGAFWQRLATHLNEFIYRKLILVNSFNEGGAMQLQFDMTRNLFPLFGAYTTKPENYFKDIKEACAVLSLSAGSALLIREILKHALNRSEKHPTSQVTDPVAALHDIGVYKLELDDVQMLLNLRIDLHV